jgi:hypothetical protein
MGRSSQSVALLIALLTGCGWIERPQSSFQVMFEAVSAGAVARGWVPGWLPNSANDLREIHDIDTNESALAFHLDPQEHWRPPSHCKAVPHRFIKDSRFDPAWWPEESVLATSYRYFHCAQASDHALEFLGLHNDGTHAVQWRVTAR